MFCINRGASLKHSKDPNIKKKHINNTDFQQIKNILYKSKPLKDCENEMTRQIQTRPEGLRGHPQASA